jgi:hypothetical protein
MTVQIQILQDTARVILHAERRHNCPCMDFDISGSDAPAEDLIAALRLAGKVKSGDRINIVRLPAPVA